MGNYYLSGEVHGVPCGVIQRCVCKSKCHAVDIIQRLISEALYFGRELQCGVLRVRCRTLHGFSGRALRGAAVSR